MAEFHHCVIIYPFPGLSINSKGYPLFEQLTNLCNRLCAPLKPVVVYDKRSRAPQDTQKILKILEESGIEVVSAWGVDTCQDWLTGWGHVLDSRVESPESEDNHRIILLPGDLELVADKTQFFGKLEEFIRYDKEVPFLVGDFESVNPRSTKELIDTYGVYPLVANWFPEAWRAIGSLSLRKPRSEFVNISIPEIRKLLGSRVFAYEQTLNMLIVSWHWFWQKNLKDPWAIEKWKTQVESMHLGTIEDDSNARHYRGAIDQIERTERMLRMVWRELNKWNLDTSSEDFRRLAEEYERLDERSTRIRDAARIAIWAQLRLELR